MKFLHDLGNLKKNFFSGQKPENFELATTKLIDSHENGFYVTFFRR